MTLDARIAQAAALLERIADEHVPAAFASSFGAEDMVLTDLIARHALPVEILTLDTGRLPDCGYLNIGCAPCTRVIAPGEDARAGRWWWESAGQRECGLHRAGTEAEA